MLNRPFPNLILLRTLLFRLCLRKFVTGLLIRKKISFQNDKPIFPAILQILDLECHGQTSLEVTFVIFGLAFMKFRELKRLPRENKKLDLYKT